MRKVEVIAVESNRYYIGETTSGATNDIYLSDGNITLKLEDCLIWDESEFSDADFYATVTQCEEDADTMRDMGWTIVEETV